MVADFNNDDWMSTTFYFDKPAASLVVRINAKKNVRVLELQGDRSLLDAFGATMPADFREMQFGDGADIPDEMKADIAHMNRLQFRWGCDLPVAAGASAEIRIPATGAGADRGVINVCYEFGKLLGLLKGKQGHYARLSTSDRDVVA